MQDKRPDFFVVGAPKSATSSLHQYVDQHPDVFVPPMKEPHFFSYPEVADTYYRVQFVTTERDYLELFAGKRSEKTAGDFSPSYLFHPAAAARIKSFQPDAKIIILLRDPVKRAISHYLHDCRLGYQEQPLSAFLRRTDDNRLYYKEYIELGMYSGQVETYLSLFGSENVLVLIYEDFARNQADALARIFRHVGVDDGFKVDFQTVHNVHETPRFGFVRRWNESRAARYSWLVPPSVRARLKRIMYTRKKPDFAAEEKSLRDIFEEDVAKLATVIGEAPRAWLSK